MKIKLGTSLLAALLAASPITSAFAQEYAHRSKFDVKFTGITVGKATFDIQFNDVSYSLKGKGKTSGLVEWISPTVGTFESAGTMIENQLRPANHKVTLSERKKKTESVVLSFAEEKVVDIQIQSNKPKKRVAPRYIPVEAQHMAAVIDPASTLVIPLSGEEARDGATVCNQRFPVFDGETRYDIKLRYKSTRRIDTEGYNGHAYVCQMRYVPVAGHKINHKQVKEMAANKKMEIWLAPMQGVSVFTPIKIVVGTPYGRFVADPTYFGGAS